nr:immunoglobulin heavy chain junction region [Macaca mulatta]MOX37745.1 immunoglobulin heavy chain junction region [Macaca mulatta]MOX37875.1 immunoglobulin heavy chain junction region [Macaca mulatta]MOX37956.1 immunoglobulin heavy chain junction region [Macaca mulatta]MOX38023.1 immunoglobulin heavy chain junction region [Macaca mulatta]
CAGDGMAAAGVDYW